MASDAHVESALILGGALDKLRADPLELWTPASKEQRQVVENLGRGEILFGGGNKSGTTAIASSRRIAGVMHASATV